MRRRSFRVFLASIFVLACCAAALAVVSAVRAGGVVTGAKFDLFVQPTVLSTSGTGFAKGVFTPPSGSGTGSATHVVITFHVPSALLNPTGTTSDCSTAAGTGENVVTCNVGTVNAGQTVRRFVTFTAPSSVPSPANPTISGSVAWDNSTTANGGGGINSLPPETASTTIFAATDRSHAGNCFLSGSGTVSTPAVNADDNQATSAQIGAPAAFLGLPCPFADVGEDPAPPGFVTAISHDTIPQLSQPARITLSLDSMPTGFQFKTFKWLFSPNYPDQLPSQSIPDCVNGQLPANAIVCLLSKTKIGNGGSWNFLQLGTGGDPSFGH